MSLSVEARDIIETVLMRADVAAGHDERDIDADLGNELIRARHHFSALLAAYDAVVGERDTQAQIAQVWRAATDRTVETAERLKARALKAEALLAEAGRVVEPFARKADALSLSTALGHVSREDLLAARDFLRTLDGQGVEDSQDFPATDAVQGTTALDPAKAPPSREEGMREIVRLAGDFLATNADHMNWGMRQEAMGVSFALAKVLGWFDEREAAPQIKTPAQRLVPVEDLEAMRLFAQDSIENGHVSGGALGNLYGIRDLIDRAMLSASPSPIEGETGSSGDKSALTSLRGQHETKHSAGKEGQ